MIKVAYQTGIKKITQTKSDEIEKDEMRTVKDIILKFVFSKYDNLQKLFVNEAGELLDYKFSVIVNNEIETIDYEVSDGDEIILLTPITGG